MLSLRARDEFAEEAESRPWIQPVVVPAALGDTESTRIAEDVAGGGAHIFAMAQRRPDVISMIASVEAITANFSLVVC